MTLALVALALLPPAWLLPWSADVAAVAWFPLRPVERALASLRRMLRNPVEIDPALDERAQRLAEERDHYRGLWFSEQLRANDLAARLEAVERVKRLDRSGSRPISAPVLGRSPTPGPRMLILGAGRDAGVSSGDPAVVRGDQLVGRVIGEPSSGRSQLALVTDPAIGRIDARIAPGSGTAAAGEGSRAGVPTDAALVPIQLVAQIGGVLVGEIAVGSGAVEGDPVVLADPSWKLAAQGMRLGVIRSLRPLDRNPLRLKAEVMPEIELDRLGSVVIKCQETP